MRSRYFLPFTNSGRQVELRAIEIKQRYGLGPYDQVEPLALAERMNAFLLDEAWFATLPPALKKALLTDHQSRWSAGSITHGGALYIVANPEHAETRRSVSVLEELVHHALGHPKSKLTRVDGTTIRTCAHDIEDEAYSVATALLMPYRTVFNHVNDGRALADLPTLAPVSLKCMQFRVKRTGLWRTYQARCRGVTKKDH